jgi:hypothetical protein
VEEGTGACRRWRLGRPDARSRERTAAKAWPVAGNWPAAGHEGQRSRGEDGLVRGLGLWKDVVFASLVDDSDTG